MFLTTLLQQRKYRSNFSVFSAKAKTFPQCGKIFGALFMALFIDIFRLWQGGSTRYPRGRKKGVAGPLVIFNWKKYIKISSNLVYFFDEKRKNFLTRY